MGFGLSPGVPNEWSISATTAHHDATQQAPAEPLRYVSRAEAEPPKKKHRIVPVALTTIALLFVLGQILNAKRNAELKLAADATDVSFGPRRPGTNPGLTSDVTPGATEAARQTRTNQLTGNFRIASREVAAPVDGSPSSVFNAEFRFETPTRFALHATYSGPQGEYDVDAVGDGPNHYCVSVSNNPQLGDRWLVDPEFARPGFGETGIVDVLCHWDTFLPNRLDTSTEDGVKLSHYRVAIGGPISHAEVWVDDTGLVRRASFVSTVVLTDDDGNAITTTVQKDMTVTYGEPETVAIPVDTVTEADLEAGL
jgi:hypothetical protein